MSDKYEQLKDLKLPRWHELPDFDIYMDQVIIYINQRLSALEITESDKPITSTMVNNYVKNSIVKPPIKKHYKRYHLAFLIVVTILKRVYSLSEISKMLEIQREMEGSDLESAYDTFGEYFESALKEILTLERRSASDMQKDNYLILLTNVIDSVVLKIYTDIKLKELSKWS